jgi:geranylgeranylglycerol-phosphate geranylgeranyltransferase
MTACLSILRPLNGVLAAASVVLGYVLCPADTLFYASPVLWRAAFSAFLISGFGNVVNDILDRKTDAVNRPDRPLPSGRLSPAAARRWAFVLLSAGLVLARSVSTAYLVMGFIVAGLLFLYSARLKSTVLWGNAVVAFLAGFTLIYGGLLTRDPRAAVIPALFAFLINLAREIVKDMEDAEGDRKSGITTLPIRAGNKTASGVAIFVLALLVLFTYYPWFAGFYTRRYVVVVTLLVNIPLVVTTFFLVRGADDRAKLRRLSAALKGIMLLGLLSILLGKGGPLCGFAFSA